MMPGLLGSASSLRVRGVRPDTPSFAVSHCWRFTLLCVLALAWRVSAHADSTDWQAQTYDPQADKIDWNPCRGLVPFQDGLNSKFPHSLVFDYLPLRAVMKGEEAFDWAELEKPLQRQAKAGCQAIVRFYLDYPNMPAGTPQFLIDQGVTMRDYDDYSNGKRNRSQMPDWNDERVVSGCERFIAAFGAAYDGDPRIGIIQAGLYGFWGEFHVYPYEGSRGHPDWQMSLENKLRLLTAYQKAFVKTQLCVRSPAGIPDPLKTAFGYHDDSFAWSTIPSKPNESYFFWPTMVAAGLEKQWMLRSMGGELRPELQDQKYWAHSPNTVGTDWKTCIDTVHPSWMLCASNYTRSLSKTNPLSQEEWDNALRGHRLLGYQLYVSEVRLPNTTENKPLEAGLKFKNVGDAPAPYSWPARFAVVKSGEAAPLGDPVDLEIQKIQPDGIEHERTFHLVRHGLTAGDYTMLFQLRHPLPNGQIVLANASMHQDVAGWLTLGRFHVGP